MESYTRIFTIITKLLMLIANLFPSVRFLAAIHIKGRKSMLYTTGQQFSQKHQSPFCLCCTVSALLSILLSNSMPLSSSSIGSPCQECSDPSEFSVTSEIICEEPLASTLVIVNVMKARRCAGESWVKLFSHTRNTTSVTWSCLLLLMTY